MTIDDDEATTTLPLLRTRERTMEARRRGTRQHHAVEEKEKNRKVVVSRTPGGGRGEGRWQQPAWAARTPIAPMTSAMLGPDHIYRRKSPAAEPPTYPGRAGPGPWGAATAVAHLYLRKTEQGTRQGTQDKEQGEHVRQPA